jgi:hypothetical protein
VACLSVLGPEPLQAVIGIGWSWFVGVEGREGSRCCRRCRRRCFRREGRRNWSRRDERLNLIGRFGEPVVLDLVDDDNGWLTKLK